MTYKGHIENGAVILDEPVALADGTAVRVQVALPESAAEEKIPSLAERLAPIIGRAQSLPPDAAENHDHYLYGTPKR